MSFLNKFVSRVVFLCLLALIAARPASALNMATAISCQDAIRGSVLHYLPGGDRDDAGVEVDYCDINNIPYYCGLAGTPPGKPTVICFFDGTKCPANVTDPDADPHSFPGIATCSGCDVAEPTPDGTLNLIQAKCCLEFGQTPC